VADRSTPYLRVVRGDATAEEIAALVAALAAVAAARARTAAAQPAPARSNWNNPARRMRAPAQPGPGGWRRSALPR
jgi:hypothetical protein